MAGFLYAIKRPTTEEPPRSMKDPVHKETLCAAGLNHVIGLKLGVFRTQLEGQFCWVYYPCAKTLSAEDAKPNVDQSRQRWKDYGKFSLGMWISEGYRVSPVRPIDVEKEVQFFSRNVIMADGNAWRIPVIPVDLPKRLTVNANGELEAQMKSEYLDLMPLVDKYWDYENIVKPARNDLNDVQGKWDNCDKLLQAELDKPEPRQHELDRLRESIQEYATQVTALADKIKTSTPPDVEIFRDTLLVLSKNYHISAYEADFLELIDNRSAAGVIYWSILDEGSLQEELDAQKKGSPPSENSAMTPGNGTLIASQDTSQPQPI